MKKTIIFLLINIQLYHVALSNSSCSLLQNKIRTLNEMLESERLSENNYEIVFFELMRFEAQLEECEQKEKNTLLQDKVQQSKKRSISF